MIRLNVFLLLEDTQKKEAVKYVATELVELSLRESGCVAYDLFESTTVDNHMLICEIWASEADLRAHQQTEHYRRLSPKLQELATVTVEKFDF